MAAKSSHSLRADNERLRSDNEELRLRLDEASQALEAIRTGQAESLVVDGPDGIRIFSLESADHAYRVLVEAMNEGAATLAEDGTILYCNSRFAQMVGGPLERVMGSSIFQFLPERSRQGFEALLGDGGQADESRGELELVGQSGQSVPAHLSVSVIHEGGRPRLCLVATDLRAQKRNEEIAANERAIEAARLIAELAESERSLREAVVRRNEFLAVLSHELRNPLAPIKNSLFILERAVPGSDQARRAQEVIGRQAGHLGRLVDDLLDVTRITRNKIRLQCQRLELNELVKRTLDDHCSVFEDAGVSLELTPAAEPVYVNGDFNRLAQVVGNLLENAAKFTEPRGVTRVSVTKEAAEERAVIRIADTGVGMSAQMLSRLFEPFSQADDTLDRAKGGLGLGLCLVKGLVELHGGEISAQSDGLGRGAELVVSLLLDLGATAEVPSVRVAECGRRRILIIEDNLDAAESLREALLLGEHEVEVARDGPHGIAKARDFKPEIVICDIGLPGMDGYEVARTMRSDDTLNGTYLVALSGYALPEDIARAHGAGFESHLAKPPSLEKLQSLLAEVSARAAG